MAKFIVKMGYTRKSPKVIKFGSFDSAEKEYNRICSQIQFKNPSRVKTVGLYQIHYGMEEFIRDFKN